VPDARVVDGSEAQFCCAGCEAVWRILHECQLDEYYRLREEFTEGKRVPAKVTGKSFEYLDDPEYLKRFAEARAEGAVHVELYLDGVHCVACSWLVEKVLMERAGAQYAQLNLGKSVVEIVFSPRDVRLSRIAQTLDRIGYTPHPIIQDSDSAARRWESKRLIARLGIAGASAANIMLLAISQYAGDVSGIEPGYSALFRWISFGLAIPAVTYSAWPFYRGAWNGLKQRMLHMDLPISLGILAASAMSIAATIQNRGDVYYDSVSALIFLLLAGRLILQRASRWAASASENLLALTSKTAKRIQSDGVREVLLTEIRFGDLIQVLPGEVVPVDGVLESDVAWIGEAHLTGEPGAVKRHHGEEIFAGSTVEQSPLELKTTAVGETTRLWGLAQMMREASARRAPITMVMDRIAGYFVATVITLATATALIWMFIDPSRALWNAAALMVVTCPCALGLATPVALGMAMGRAARRGLFVRGQDGIERLARVRHVIFDKTGTLTHGFLNVVSATYANDLDSALQDEILDAVAALESQSGHAIASAFRDIDTQRQVVREVSVTAGAGVQGLVNSEHFAVGSAPYVSDFVTEMPSRLQLAAQETAERGLTVVYVARNRQVVTVYGLGDSVHPEAKDAVIAVRRAGMTVELLSGDHTQAVARIAEELNIIDFHGCVTPEEKLAHIEQLENQGIRAAMIGDGVNDAAALSLATVGISVAGAAEVARDAADVFISTARGPEAIAELFQLSRRAFRRLRLNLGIAVGYNLFGAALAMTGHVGPLVAAILMPVSSLTVLFIATRR
jgi:Cu2+-exporting ATPase